MQDKMNLLCDNLPVATGTQINGELTERRGFVDKNESRENRFLNIGFRENERNGAVEGNGNGRSNSRRSCLPVILHNAGDTFGCVNLF